MDELELIDNLKSMAGENSLGLSDDCAVFGEYCITKDVLSEDVHFFKDDAPFNLARKAIRVNLSDLAAMGAEPFGVLIGACLSKEVDDGWLQEFNKGIKSDIDEFGFQLLGGDTVFHDAPMVISVTAIGKTPKPLLRSGAKIGDNIFVSGRIGGAYLGLQAKRSTPPQSPPIRGGVGGVEFIKNYELPYPQIDLGIKLRSIANSCMDISDGLLLDLSRLCKTSNVGAELSSNLIPLADENCDLIEQISGGDDYELLFTAAESEIEGCYEIGKIVDGTDIKLDEEVIQPKGFVHT